MSGERELDLIIKTMQDKHASDDRKFEKLFDRQDQIFNRIDEMGIVMTRNTETVIQHERRSTALESIVESVTATLRGLTDRITRMDNDIKNIGGRIEPIETHVKKVNKFVVLWDSLPKLVQVPILMMTLFTSGYGVYKIIMEAISK